MKEGSFKLIDFYPGAHIRIKYKNFYHHGIYISDDRVVEFGHPKLNLEPDKIEVIVESLKDFAMNNNFIEVYEYSKDELKKKNKDTDIIRIALSHVGDKGYNIIHNNCEHFVNFCIFNEKKSNQMDKIKKNAEAILKGEK